MVSITLEHVTRSFASDAGSVTPLRDLTLTIPAGVVTAVVGESGCGKTTLLRIVAGLDRPDSGSVAFEGAAAPRISYVFQEPRLFGWMSVRENVACAIRHLPAAERARRVGEVLALVGLAHSAGAMPAELSGGMAQRVGIARALAPNPDILLLDEAFSALDALTRQRLYREFTAILADHPMTTLLITHDVTEAVLLARRVVRLAGGCVRAAWDVPFPYPRTLATPGCSALADAILQQFLTQDQQP